MFFNPHQHAVADGIVKSVEAFGTPRIVESGGGLTIAVERHEVQALFAFDLDRNVEEPVGIAVYSRTSPSEITILHVAVHPAYTLRSRRAGLGLGGSMMAQVRRVAARVAGVRRIVSCYRR